MVAREGIRPCSINRLNQVRFHCRGRLYPCVSITTNSEALTARTRKNEDVRFGSGSMQNECTKKEKEKKEYSTSPISQHTGVSLLADRVAWNHPMAGWGGWGKSHSTERPCSLQVDYRR